MSYSPNNTARLAEAHRKGYGAQKASLQALGTPTAQHNVNVTKSAAKKSAAKKSVAKKSAAKKSSATKKTAAKKTTTKKS